MHANFVNRLWAPVWDITGFPDADLRSYSHEKMLIETRRGLVTMCIAFSVMMLADACLYFLFFSDTLRPTYTCVMLALLGIYIAFMSRNITDQRALHLLGMTALIIGGMAYILLAQQTGNFNVMLFTSITLLFILIPIVPWGLREAMTIALLIYITFTISTWGRQHLFDRETLWTLQFIMLGAIAIALIIVARNTRVCKADLQARFELEKAHRKILEISNKDPLTGAWNRRYYDQVFREDLNQQCQKTNNLFFGFIDLNDFKKLNDVSGHASGDKVLQQLVKAFQVRAGEGDEIIRMGGDEFAICFHSDNVEDYCQRLYEEYINLCKQAKLTGATPSFSVGVIALRDHNSNKIDQLYHAADEALYSAKRGKAIHFGQLKFCLAV